MKSAFITGDEGFIGRHFRTHLESQGWQVFGCDIKSGRDCRDIFPLLTRQFDLVVHAAAIVGGRATIEGQPLRVAMDLAIDAEMFNWAVRTNQPRVLFFSSSAAYPVGLQDDPDTGYRLREADIDLTCVRTPDLSYGWVKITGEMLAGLARTEGVAVTVVRPFSGYGPDQDLTYPFPSFMQRARQRDDPFTLWGDGRQTRDFIHVDDVIGACEALIEAGATTPVNLGTGRAVSFNNLAELTTRTAGYTPRIERLTDKPVGVMNRVADITQLTGYYTPRIDLEHGIWQALHQ